MPKIRPIIALALLLAFGTPSVAYAAEPTSSAPVAAAHAPSRQVPLKVVKTALGTYVVVSGDTLSGIAPRFNMTWPDLWSLNKNIISNPDLIFPDQRLETTGTAAPAPAPAAPAPAPRASNGWANPAPGVCRGDGLGAGRGHEGVDLGSAWGVPIYAAAAGTVVSEGWSNLGGYDTAISHGGGVWTAYMHQSSRAVSVGQWVAAGQIIGYVGNTGPAGMSPHLHFEVNTSGPFDGPIDPVAFMANRGITWPSCW